MATATVANFAARGILSVSASRGIDVSSLMLGAGVDVHLLAEPGARLPLESVIRLWEKARRSTLDEAFPLHVAEFLPFGAYKTYDLLLATAPTVGDALRKASRYNSYVNDAFRPSLRQKGGEVYLEYLNCVDPQCNPPEYIEFIFACFLLRFRLTTGVNLKAKETHFRHSAPRNLSEHYRIFQAPIRFRQPATRVILEPAMLRIPQLYADTATSELLDHYIQATLKHSCVFDELTVALRRTITGQASFEGKTLSAVARELGMSRRNLQRRLAARGTSYREVCRALRCEFALTLLRNGDISMKEASDLLGFSEPSSFSRAFRKWTGKNPHDYRRNPSS